MESGAAEGTEERRKTSQLLCMARTRPIIEFLEPDRVVEMPFAASRPHSIRGPGHLANGGLVLVGLSGSFAFDPPLPPS